MPQVTIFIPVYNTEKYLAEAIESIIKQSYKDWELVILDDCSTDKTNEIAQSYADADERIILQRNKSNLGMMRNWNKGLPLCKNEYFGKLDADDTWEKDAIKDAVAALDRYTEVGLVCSKYINMDEEGKAYNEQPPEPPEFAKDKPFTGEELVKQGPEKIFAYNILKQGIILLRRTLFDELGFFKVHDNGDTEMWYRIGCHYKIYGIDKIYHHHRLWSESFMRTSVDIDADRRNKNLHDTRHMIFDYYLENQKIDKSQHSKFIRGNDFLYNSYLIFKARKRGAYLKMFVLLLRNLRINSKKTIRENLHINRVVNIFIYL